MFSQQIDGEGGRRGRGMEEGGSAYNSWYIILYNKCSASSIQCFFQVKIFLFGGNLWYFKLIRIWIHGGTILDPPKSVPQSGSVPDPRLWIIQFLYPDDKQNWMMKERATADLWSCLSLEVDILFLSLPRRGGRGCLGGTSSSLSV